jgi:carotenoid cleavage dioxygenase-like enzyme
MVWCEIDPCYVFHFLNGFSEGNRVIVDGGKLNAFPEGDGGGPATGNDNYLTRFTIDLDTRSVSCEQIGTIPGGYVQVAPSVAGLDNRYGYMATFSGGKAGLFDFDSVTKFDLHHRRESIYCFGEGRVTGEMIFAADPDGKAEDDGWLLSLVYDVRDDSTEFVILDARALEAGPVAQVALPRRVPCGFHANWFPD